MFFLNQITSIMNAVFLDAIIPDTPSLQTTVPVWQEVDNRLKVRRFLSPPITCLTIYYWPPQWCG